MRKLWMVALWSVLLVSGCSGGGDVASVDGSVAADGPLGVDASSLPRGDGMILPAVVAVDGAIDLTPGREPPRVMGSCSCSDGTILEYCGRESCQDPGAAIGRCDRFCRSVGASGGFPGACGDPC